jgi:hypothetical protein
LSGPSVYALTIHTVTDVEPADGGGEQPAPPRVDHAVVVARAGFQSLPQANNAVDALFSAFPAIGNGTGGKAFRIPAPQLAQLLRDLADVLDGEHLHQRSGAHVLGAAGIDNWSISIQAEAPSP